MTEELRWGQELRWGLIGCGKISHDFGKSLDKAEKPHKVVACAASSLERAQKFAKEHFPHATPYGSYEELLKDPHIDAVYVGVHNEAHCPWAAKAVEAGKHVLCEKPFGTCAGEVRQTIKRLKNRKTFLMEAFWSRFFPAWRYIRNIVDTKEWGEPRVVQANFGYPHEDNWRCNERAEGALTLYGLYVIMLSHYIYKRKPEKVSVIGAKDKVHDSDEWATIVLEYGPQQRAVLYYDSRTWLPQNAFVSFDKGHITLPEYFWCPEKLIRWEGETWYNNEHNKKTIEFPLNDDRFFNYNHSSGLRYEADHLYEQVQKGRIESDFHPLSATLEIVETMDEVRRQLGVHFPHDDRFK
ncbi:unnamed protein product [Bursaphelenchus xylophilus]|uniref:Trans-1,2-dihydrobenzene-1,2-diol dehydrogenase n=1 Tax=Bursaphelenchus xylophilus TaxID=6326 RepID=A0A1I7SUL4_BURXY|nr:unnamed protein product [Bursaphelenchus xylophilus]CAG9118600.1 unnamed protein product [Bursaphelenchus xylophilus]